MTTDNQTLADVQPGGRVRLGDALLPCPFCGNDAEFVPYKNNGLTLKCKSMGCIQRHQRTLRYGIDWLRTSMTEHWNTRALSSQPSPGGQDAHEMADALERIASGALSDYEGVDADELHILRCAKLIRDLAARQPVGEPVSEAIEQLAEDVESCVSDACAYLASDSGWDDYGIYRDDAEARYRALPDRIRALSAPPAQADQEYLESLDRALEGVIDERDRYHEMADDLAGHIAAITGVDIGEHSSANCPWQNAIEAAEEYQPAQAVDLGQFRDLIGFAALAAISLPETDPRRDFILQSNELAKLIDDQAAGND